MRAAQAIAIRSCFASGRAHRDEEFCDLGLEAVAIARQHLRHEATGMSWLGRADRFGNQANPEYGLARGVEQLHAPLAVLRQTACDTAEEIGADPPHLAPCRLMALEFQSPGPRRQHSGRE